VLQLTSVVGLSSYFRGNYLSFRSLSWRRLPTQYFFQVTSKAADSLPSDVRRLFCLHRHPSDRLSVLFRGSVVDSLAGRNVSQGWLAGRNFTKLEVKVSSNYPKFVFQFRISRSLVSAQRPPTSGQNIRAYWHSCFHRMFVSHEN